MIVDDRLLRIGSANLNNRSMGTDSECDLALEAANAEDRAAISRLLHRLLAEHLGRDSEEIAAMLAQEGSLLGLVARCAGGERRLAPIDVSGAPSDELSRTVGQIADPRRPTGPPDFFGDRSAGRPDGRPYSPAVSPPAAPR